MSFSQLPLCAQGTSCMEYTKIPVCAVSNSTTAFLTKNEKEEIRSDAFYLAMFAFGTSTFLLGTYMVRAIDFDPAILAQGFFFGGLAQLYSGVTSFFKGDTIGSYICMMFGLWWVSLITSILLPQFFSGTDLDNLNLKGLLYNVGWLSFLISAEIIFLSSWRKDIVSPIACVFVITTCIFVMVYSINSEDRTWAIRFAGVTCMISGVLGFYIGAGRFLSAMYERSILPCGFSSANDN